MDFNGFVHTNNPILREYIRIAGGISLWSFIPLSSLTLYHVAGLNRLDKNQISASCYHFAHTHVHIPHKRSLITILGLFLAEKSFRFFFFSARADSLLCLTTRTLEGSADVHFSLPS